MTYGNVAILLALLSTSCLGSRHEVARATSPTGRVDAVLVEVNGGATTSFAYEIDIVPRGQPFSAQHAAAWLYGAIRNERAYGVNLRWTADNHLVAEFLRAHSDTVLLPLAIVAGDTITVSLRPGVLDSTAPPGGMLYNRQEHDQ